MKQQNTMLGTNQNRFQPANNAEGFILLMMVPVFLVLLAFATAIAGCISCSIQAMAHRNEMIQAYSLLEDDEAVWQEEAFPDKWKTACEQNYERIVSTRQVGPYILIIKEMRNKTTGEVLVNRLEFIPIETADGRQS